MKSKIRSILIIICLCYIGYQLGSYITYQNELRQLTKDKLRIEIQLLKIQIEINKSKLPKRTIVYGKLLNRTK